MEEVLREALNLLNKGEPFVIATVVGTKGSTPQKPGAKLLVRVDGSGVGTLGGGCVEGDIWFAASRLLKEGGGPTLTDYELNEEIAAREGLVCGGTMNFLIDPVLDPALVLPQVLRQEAIIDIALTGSFDELVALITTDALCSRLEMGSCRVMVRQMLEATAEWIGNPRLLDFG